MMATRTTGPLLLAPLALLALIPATAAQKRQEAGPFLQWVQAQGHHRLTFKERKLDAAVQALLKGKILPLTHKALESKNTDLQVQALLTLGALGGKVGLTTVLPQVRTGRGDLRRGAILAVGLGGVSASAGDLRAVLDEDGKSPAAERLAAVALGLLGPGAGCNHLQGKLAVKVTRSQKSMVQEILGLLSGLSLCAGPADAQATLTFLTEKRFIEPELFGMALWYTARLDPQGSLKMALKGARKDRGYQDYALAALGYADKANKKALDALTAAAGSGRQSLPVRTQALLALGRLGGKPSWKPLHRVGRKCKGELAHVLTLARALAEDPDKSWRQELFKDVGKAPAAGRRAACALALGLLKHPAAPTPLTDALAKEKAAPVQVAQLLALGMLGGSAGVAPALRLFCTSTDPHVIRTAALVLGALAPGTDLPSAAEKGLLAGKSTGAWALRLRWCGWFGGSGVVELLVRILENPTTKPAAAAEIMRALRVAADGRPVPAAARLLLHGPFPRRVAAMDEACKLIWGL